jgi:hypothetical protein
MKLSIFRDILIACAALVFAPASHAMLLVGWHDFDGTADPETPDYAAPGFSGTIPSPSILTKNTDSRDLGGDNGGVVGGPVFYGNSNIASGTGNDGAVRLIPSGSGAVFSMTNNSGSAISLASLFFDATAASGTSVVVAYRIGAAAFQTLGTFSGLAVTGDFTNPALAQDFSDLSQSLTGITVGHLQKIDFRFTTSSGARLDNIAITAIPEPASLIALGCVLGSGLLMRRRPMPLQLPA